MSLHPTAAQLVAEMNAARPADRQRSVGEVRAVLAKLLADVSRPEVAYVADLTLPVDGDTIPARLYRPERGSTRPLPLIVYFHGGGWLLGSVDTHDPITRRLALATGMAVLSVGYRRGPEARFPTAVDDAVAAVRWAVAQADDFGVDPARLAVAGDSAGGNLATVAAAVLSGDTAVRVRHQLLIYPVTTYDMERGFDDRYEDVVLSRDEMLWFRGNYLATPQQADDPRFSPLGADLRGLPSATVVLAECDPIRPQGTLYVEALRRAGVTARVREYPGMLHGFFGLDTFWDEGRAAMEFAAGGLVEALRPNPEPA
ncbi:alpha/beta hydrolase fold domain-containing protein [Streptomyces sp. NPDC051658]|uniref:alpha/beta hydrolase n=1 Tax=Streptomyces sp. NPDC051658 TaxID=3365667 RepID=UPI00379FB926